MTSNLPDNARLIADLVEGTGAIDGFVTMLDASSPEPHASPSATLNDVSGHVSQSDNRNAVDGAQTAREARSFGFDVEALNEKYAVAIWGGKAVVLHEKPDAPFYDVFRVLSVDAFNKWFENRITEVPGTDGKPRVISWARAWMTHRQRRAFEGVEFFPNPDGAAATPGYCNLWRGFGVIPSPDGTCATFKDHLLTNLCRGDTKLYQYVFGWMAHIVQRPRERLGTALVLRGKMGTGKTKVGEVLGSLFPFHYFPVDQAQYVTGQFNDHMAGCLLLQADEAVWAGDKNAEGRLKGMITSDTQMINGKNVGAIRLKNYMRVIMTSNEDWVIPAGMDERRFCVLDVGDHCAQNNEYFGELDRELSAGGRERLLYELLNFDLAQVNLWTIPKTRALLDQKLKSLDGVDTFWYNRLWDGVTASDGSAWLNRSTSAHLYSEYLKSSAQIANGRRRSLAEFGSRMHKLVPTLRKVRFSLESSPGVMVRHWGYDIPSLDECRKSFEKLLGQTIDWPLPTEGEEEPADYSVHDEEIPV